MPWKSKQQARWGHSKAGIKALGGKEAVAEWDSASHGLRLPDHVKKQMNKAAEKRAKKS